MSQVSNQNANLVITELEWKVYQLKAINLTTLKWAVSLVVLLIGCQFHDGHRAEDQRPHCSLWKSYEMHHYKFWGNITWEIIPVLYGNPLASLKHSVMRNVLEALIRQNKNMPINAQNIYFLSRRQVTFFQCMCSVLINIYWTYFSKINQSPKISNCHSGIGQLMHATKTQKD